MATMIDETGNTYGTITVIEPSGKSHRQYRWLCRCECGREFEAAGGRLRSGDVACKSCSHIKHGGAKKNQHAAEYRTWQSIKRRCDNKSQDNYERYGGRGITMCAGWRESFAAFFAAVGVKPTPGHSIDRKEVNGNYSCGECEECIRNNWPMNVRWATDTEQRHNRRDSRKAS